MFRRSCAVRARRDAQQLVLSDVYEFSPALAEYTPALIVPGGLSWEDLRPLPLRCASVPAHLSRLVHSLTPRYALFCRLLPVAFSRSPQTTADHASATQRRPSKPSGHGGRVSQAFAGKARQALLTCSRFNPREIGRLRRRRQALGTESESNTKYSVVVENSGDESRVRAQVLGIQGRFERGPVDHSAMKNSCGCHAATRRLPR
jgi:hypothetical protein